MAWTKEDRSFKTLINRRTTDVNKAYYEEFGDQTINTHIREVWMDPIPQTPPGSSTSSIIQENLFVLTEDITVGGQQAWYAESAGNRIKNWISPKFNAPGNNFGYTVKLFDGNDNEIFPTDPSDWFFDYQTGILTFGNSTSSLVKPFKITGYRYVGQSGNIVKDVSYNGTSGLIVQKTDGSFETIPFVSSGTTIATRSTIGSIELATYEEIIEGINTGSSGPLGVQPGELRRFGLDLRDLVLPAPDTSDSPGEPGKWSYDDYFIYFCMPFNPENIDEPEGETGGLSGVVGLPVTETKQSYSGLSGASTSGNITANSPIITNIELVNISFLDGSVFLEWVDDPGLSGFTGPYNYQILRAKGYHGDDDLELVATVANQEFTDTNVDTLNGVWNYRIKQFDNFGVEIGTSVPIWIWRGGARWKRTTIEVW